MDNQKRYQAYWKKNVSVIRNLLIVWATVSFGVVICLGDVLSDIRFFGVNLSFWFAHQGAIIVFVLLILYYAWKMDKIDKEYGVEE